MKTGTTKHRPINSYEGLQREKELLKLREILVKSQLADEVKQLEESLSLGNILKSLLSGVTRLDLGSAYGTFTMFRNLFSKK